MKIILLNIIFSLSVSVVFAQVDKSDWIGGFPEGCTSITAGKNATVDGSVITSHTDDSHRTRSWMDIIPEKTHPKDATVAMYKRVACDSLAMPTYAHNKIGEIPQVEKTYGYINTAYPCMNQKQLAIGESTFGGRSNLQSDKGIIDCQRLIKLMLERTSTAREAIKTGGDLLMKYGWNDAGECLTIADKKEVWHMEIVGPGKGGVGAVWVAQRVPDNHVSVNANASTIKEIDLKNKDFFMASDNIFKLAEDSGWYHPKKEKFVFCEIYAPHSRNSIASRRREWRVFDLLAPSLKLDPNDKNYPFSVKPDKKVSMEMLVEVFKDYYQGTPYDMRNNIKTTNDKGETIISPLANPFMPYDELNTHNTNVNGSWFYTNNKTGKTSFLGERTIARWYTMYATIIQCRDWLPDEVGGVAWIAQDNVASSIYIPVYAGTTDLPKSYKTPGRPNGFTRESAWWAFNRMGTLAAQRWGDMSKDIDSVWIPMQKELFANQKNIDDKFLEIAKSKSTKDAKVFLTEYSSNKASIVVEKAWYLGDYFWTKYDEKF